MTQQPQKSQILTQAVQSIQVRLGDWKQGAVVPKLKIKNTLNNQVNTYRLTGDQYLLGRNSKQCDIVIDNPKVGRVHCFLERDPQNPTSFIIRDKNSTNGIYFNKRRQQSISLHNGESITLGPPNLADGVQIQYYYPPPLWILFIRYFLYGTGLLSIFLCIIILSNWSQTSITDWPAIEKSPVVVYAKDGKTKLNPPNIDIQLKVNNLSDFSPQLRKALIASEDVRFYWHLGVDPIGILRAILINLRKDRIKQGASTITQQLARTIFSEVGRENTIGRKLREIFVALKLETVYSKDDILLGYMNRVFLGFQNYGFENAARFYFDKSAKELNWSESATLVAILPAPNAFNPVVDHDLATEQRNIVLDRLLKLGIITPEEEESARRSVIQISPRTEQGYQDFNNAAPYFYSYILEELKFLLPKTLASEGNFIIETGLDLELQEKLQQSLQESINTDGKTYKFNQGAAVTLNSETGEILAMTGGYDYTQNQFNRATRAQRQPGSTFKVFAIAAALERGISPYTTYSCGGLTWKGQRYQPCSRSSGNINMFQTFAQSENSPSLRIARQVGLDRVIDIAKDLGIRSPLEEIPGLILGQKEVNVLEITGSYAAFANQGRWNRPHGINVIRDGNDCDITNDPKSCKKISFFNHNKVDSQQVIKPETAEIMTDMMQQVVLNGTGRSARIGGQYLGEGGKTGTTNNNVDMWFIGYLPDYKLTTGVWLGNDDTKPRQSGGSFLAVRLWKNYMEKVVNEENVFR